MPEQSINRRGSSAKRGEIIERLVDTTGLKHRAQEILPTLRIQYAVFFKSTKGIR
jgi:hypothetical protein